MLTPDTVSGPQPAFVSTAAPGVVPVPTGCDPKSTTGGASAGTGGKSRMYTLIVREGPSWAPSTSVWAFEKKATNRPFPATAGPRLRAPPGPPERPTETSAVSPAVMSRM